MNLPGDLNDYRAPQAFDLIPKEVAGYALFAMLLLCWIADRLGWLK